MNADDFAKCMAMEAGEEMVHAFGKIKHCVEQLSEEQVWWRPRPEMNAVGNLLLHLAGNVRQRIIAGLTGSPDTRDRPAEFAERGPIAKEELLRRLEGTIQEAVGVLNSCTAQGYLTVRNIQGHDMTCLRSVFSSVPHFRGHTQEIVHMTRALLGPDYRFAWTPHQPVHGA